MNGYIKGLDGLRALAIILVVLHHSHFLPPEGSLFGVTELLGSGVDLFFIISGYLITNILINLKGKSSFFKKFYARRFLRIVPLYFLVLAFAFFIVPNINLAQLDKLKNTTAWPYWTFLSNYYIASIGRFQNGLVDLSWSLSVEEQFYVFWSLCVFFFSNKTLKQIALGILFVSPILRFILIDQGVNLVAIHVMSITRMDTLMMGSLLALTLKERVVNPRFYLCGFLSSLIILIGLFQLPIPYLVSSYYTVLGVLFSCLVGYVIGQNKSATSEEGYILKFLEFKPLALVGLYSYGIYLFHNPIQKALRVVVSHFNISQSLTPINMQLAFYFMVMAIAFILASISYHFYEAKWLKLKSKFES
jgi:peptidoglycan/LPS O-acetylase OafA/YrhL